MEATIRGQYDLICDLEAELEELRGFSDYIETSECAAAIKLEILRRRIAERRSA